MQSYNPSPMLYVVNTNSPLNVVRISVKQTMLRQRFLYIGMLIIEAWLKFTLTLSQWSSSGNPVAIQCACNLDTSVHWTNNC